MLAVLLHSTPAVGVSQTSAWYKEWNYGTFAEGTFAFSGLTLLVGRQERHTTRKKYGGMVEVGTG